MLIIGTGGLASDILSSIELDEEQINLVFYNDTAILPKKYIEDNFEILTSAEQAAEYFRTKDNRFVVAIGDNISRKQLSEKFEKLGGQNVNYISSKAVVSKYATIGEKGLIILPHLLIANGCSVANGCVILPNASLGHGCTINEYSLISGNVCMSDTTIGSFSTVGIGASFKPGVKVGNYSFISVGTVVTKDIEDGYVVAGNPGRAIRKLLIHADAQ